jgi:molybdate transport repressor ModE-like protein
MHRIAYKLRVAPQWVVDRPGQSGVALPQVLSLCAALHERGSLAEASKQLRVSYRHAWGLLREAGALFGVPLVAMTRGRGAKLTPFGEKLLWADKRIAARLSPLLDTLASELQGELERVLKASPSLLRIHASHGFAVEALHETLVADEVPVEVRYIASQEALASLQKGGCELAGFHVPTGALQTRALQQYRRLLDAKTLRIINLATRQQGLIVARGNPLSIRALKDLARPNVRYINRQSTSGTRILFDLLLEDEGIDPRRIRGYETAEYTHAAVAAYVGSGMADAAFGVETGARRFGLDFIPICVERYFLACRSEALPTALLAPALAIMQRPQFKAKVNALPGYNARDAGSVMTLRQAFG